MFALHEVDSEYAKSILAHTEKKINVHGEYANGIFAYSLYTLIHINLNLSRQLSTNTKSRDPIDHLSMKGGMVEKTISSYFSFNLGSCLSVLNGGIVAACHRQLGTL